MHQKAVEKLEGDAQGHTLDLSDESAVENFFAKLGAFDHLVFTAGDTLHLNDLVATDLKQARRAFELRYWAALAAVKYGSKNIHQRSLPLTFAPKPQPGGQIRGPSGEVAGEWTLDTAFRDGAAAKPHGVIYIVSGAGGASLYNPEQQADPSTWLPFTNKFLSQVHSFSMVDIDGKSLRLKQVSDTGKELDAFRIVK